MGLRRRQPHAHRPAGQAVRRDAAARLLAVPRRALNALARGSLFALSLTVLTALAAFDGGYYAPSWGWAALAFLWATAVALLVRREIALGSFELWWLAAFAALTGWTWLSNTWSVSPTLTLLEGHRGLLYLAGAALVVIATPRDARRELLAAVAVSGALVATYALVRYHELAFGEPIGYSNALALFAAMAALLALGFVVEASRRSVRLAAAAALVPLAAVMMLTASRGGWLALSVGSVVLVVLTKRRRFVVLGVGAVAALALLSVAVVARTNEAAPSATSLRAELLTLAGHYRGRYWAAAAESFADHPLLGSGAGTFARMWLRYRDEDLGVLDAHNVYLEDLSELGPVGLALLVVTFGIPLLAAFRARGAPLVAPAAAAYSAYVIHAGFDWDWELPVVTVAAILSGGYLVLAAPTPRRHVLTVSARGAAFALTLGIGVIAFFGVVANSALTSATVALDEGRFDDAANDASRARGWALWSAEPSRLLAEAELARGHRESARTLLGVALRRDPGDVQSWRLLGRNWPRERRHADLVVHRLDPHGPPP